MAVISDELDMILFAADFEHGSDSGDRPEPTPSPPGESPTVNTESRAIVKLNVSINGIVHLLMVVCWVCLRSADSFAVKVFCLEV